MALLVYTFVLTLHYKFKIMGKFIHVLSMILCIVGVVACSRQETKMMSPSPDNNVSSTNPYNMRVVGGRTGFTKNDLGSIRYAPDKVEQLQVILRDGDGVELTQNTSLKPNETYYLVVTNLNGKQVKVKSSDGFTVSSNEQSATETVFHIKTNSEIPSQLFVSLVPTSGVNQRAMVKYSPQNFLLPIKK